MSLQYRPLNVEAYEVRMLSLSYDATSSQVKCAMRHVSLVFNPPQYVALSYCWGDKSVTKDIIVNGAMTAVTVNLEAALQRLQQRIDGNTMLWVDAVCINQDDSQERSLQVGFMKEIYEKAQIVYAWLGDNDFEEAMLKLQCSRTLVSRSGLEHNASKQDATPAVCAALLSICKSPLWQRRWIIQELIVASTVQVMSRTQSITLDDLISVYSSCSKSEFWLAEHQLVSEPLRAILDFRTKYHEGQALLLFETIIDTKQYQSSDPRDKIYALIGICSDGRSLVPTPNYLQTVGHICADLTRAAMRQTSNLNIILHLRPTDVPSSLPTWSPYWLSSEIERDITTLAYTKTLWPRSLVTTALQADPNVLRMQGVTLGTVTAFTSPLTWDGPSPPASAVGSLEFASNTNDYYESSRTAVFALVSCLLARGMSTRTSIFEYMKVMDDAAYHIFLWSLRFKACRGRPSDHNDPTSVLIEWQQLNQRFKLTGKSIENLLQLRNLSGAALALVVLLLLFLSTGVVYILLIDGKFNLGRPKGAVIIIVTLCLAIPLLPFIIWFTFGSFWEESPKSMLSKRISQSQRIFVLDRGTIGFAHASIKAGDKVCLFAGCTQAAAVLREQRIDGVMRYSVVGSATAELNRSDRKRYEPILRNSPKHADEHILDWQRRMNDMLEECTRQDWWEVFDLI